MGRVRGRSPVLLLFALLVACIRAMAQHPHPRRAIRCSCTCCLNRAHPISRQDFYGRSSESLRRRRRSSRRQNRRRRNFPRSAESRSRPTASISISMARASSQASSTPTVTPSTVASTSSPPTPLKKSTPSTNFLPSPTKPRNLDAGCAATSSRFSDLPLEFWSHPDVLNRDFSTGAYEKQRSFCSAAWTATPHGPITPCCSAPASLPNF